MNNMLVRVFVFLLINFHTINAVIPEKVIICGVCRDVGTRLPYTIKIMEEIGGLFSNYKVIVYENNSKDITKTLLNNWKKKNPRIFVRSENLDTKDLAPFIVNKKNNQFFRPEEIARARNIVLDIAMSSENEAYTYLIWMDMDFKISPRIEGIVEVFKSEKEWDAVFAYGIDPSATYWDWYAFRDNKYPIGSELLGNAWWYMPKQFHLKKSSDWYPVYSAFGGCGIYKKSSIEGCRYSATVTKDLEIFAASLIEQGQRENHPQIMEYLKSLSDVEDYVKIDSPSPNLVEIQNPKTGIILQDTQNSLIWRMSSFVYRYPSVCEHVPFHASMIIRGHGKLFINPRLVFTYGG